MHGPRSGGSPAAHPRLPAAVPPALRHRTSVQCWNPASPIGRAALPAGPPGLDVCIPPFRGFACGSPPATCSGPLWGRAITSNRIAARSGGSPAAHPRLPAQGPSGAASLAIPAGPSGVASVPEGRKLVAPGERSEPGESAPDNYQAPEGRQTESRCPAMSLRMVAAPMKSTAAITSATAGTMCIA